MMSRYQADLLESQSNIHGSDTPDFPKCARSVYWRKMNSDLTRAVVLTSVKVGNLG